MKVNDLIGKKALDKNVMEIGKISEISFDKNTYELSKIYVSTGNAISKKYFTLTADKIMAIGDFVQVNDIQDNLMKEASDKIPKAEDIITMNDIIGKKVLDINANDTGKVNEIIIDEAHKIAQITVSKSLSFGKTSTIVVFMKDITAIGEYVLLNKVLDFENNEVEEESDKESEEEKVEVKIE